ncbi:MAG: hypothetical protein WC792_02720 [Candidatus Micrarchaeia archaeon]|jgi:hypothetical protein
MAFPARRLAGVLGFNALMLALALWQSWGVLAALFGYAVESLMFSAFLVPFQKRATGRRVVTLEALLFAFINFSLILFLCFSAYETDAPGMPIVFAVVATFFGFLWQYGQTDPKSGGAAEPSRFVVWARAIPAVLATAILFQMVSPSVSGPELQLVLVAFYCAKAFVEGTAVVAESFFGK